MSSRNSEWNKAMSENKEVTITIFSCNMADELKNNNPFAKQISKLRPNITVIAPDGFVIYGLTMGKP